jgi:Mce-associated membrane protein
VEDQQPAASDLTAKAESEAETNTPESAESAESAQNGDAPTEVATASVQPKSRFGRLRRKKTAGETEDKTEETAEPAAAGDTEVATGTVEAGEAVDTPEDAAATANDSDTAGESEAAEGEQPQVITFRSHRPARKGVAAAVLMAALIFIGSAGFAGAALYPYKADRAVEQTKLTVARTAAGAITALWTYTPENMDGLADRAKSYLSGDFEAQYRKFVDAIVAPNKQAKVTNNTEVAGVGVESLEEPNAIAIVYTNTTSTSPLTKNVPSLKYLSYRLFMKRTNGRWLVNRMTTITSLDLTPHL